MEKIWILSKFYGTLVKKVFYKHRGSFRREKESQKNPIYRFT